MWYLIVLAIQHSLSFITNHFCIELIVLIVEFLINLSLFVLFILFVYLFKQIKIELMQ